MRALFSFTTLAIALIGLLLGTGVLPDDERTVGPISGSAPPVVHDFTILPDGTCFAATSAGVFRHTQGESGWTHVSPAPPNRSSHTERVTFLAQDTTGNIFAGRKGATMLARTHNRGTSWIRKSEALRDADGSLSGMTLLDQTPAGIFAGFSSDGLYHSDNQGRTWTRAIPLSDSSAQATALAVLPDGSHLAAMSDRFRSQPFLYQSEDGTAPWTQRPAPPVAFGTLVASGDGILYGSGFGTNGQFGGYRSDDAGQTWQSEDALQRALVLTRTPSGQVWGLGLGGTVLRRDSEGWEELSITEDRVRAYAEAPDGTAYLGTENGVIRKLPGDAWEPFNEGLQSTNE